MLKKHILIILIILIGLTGCSSKRYYNNFEYDEKSNFIPTRDEKGFFLDTKYLKESAKDNLSQIFNEIEKGQEIFKNKNDMTKEERYKILFSKRI